MNEAMENRSNTGLGVTESRARIERWNEEWSDKDPKEVLSFFLNEFRGKIALSTSMGAEDQVLTDMVAGIDKTARVFTLDTGRLFPETYNLIDNTKNHYDIDIEVFFPRRKEVEAMVKEKGMNLFYKSVENRKQCCSIRKIEPLLRAFENLEVWICGLRKDQSVSRFSSKLVEWDEPNGLIKINPLINWSEDQVWDYIKENEVPFNPLHERGFASIGCQPCTRSIKPGEDFKAGRWWWEELEHKECGLHKR